MVAELAESDKGLRKGMLLVRFNWNFGPLIKLSTLSLQPELKSKQKALVSQLQPLLYESLGPPLRCSLGQSFVALYESGETFSMHDTIGKCCDVLRAKEDSATAGSNKL